MSYEVYKVLHLLGLSMVVMSLAGIVAHVMNGGSKANNSFRKGLMITHGVGLTLLLVAGFGLLAKLGIHEFPTWVIGKLVIWVALAAGVGLAYRRNLARGVWVSIPILVALAAVLAIVKP